MSPNAFIAAAYLAGGLYFATRVMLSKEGTFWMLALSAIVIGFGWLPIMVTTAAVREVMRRRRA